MNEGQLNRLWLAEGNSNSPLAIGIKGLTAQVIYISRTLQTMLVFRSDGIHQDIELMTYVRKRRVAGVVWEPWQSFAGS